MSNQGSPEGHMGHTCVVTRATHDMPDIEYVFFVHNVFLHLETISKRKKHSE
jgi:hypothetical protein